MGGVSVYVVNLVKYINRDKYEIHIVTEDNKKEWFNGELRDNGITRIPMVRRKRKHNFFNYLERVFSLIKLVRKEKYDLLYFNISQPLEIFRYPLIARIFGKSKILIHAHNGAGYYNDFVRRALYSLSRNLIHFIADYKLTCSEKAAKFIFGSQVENVIRINNGVELGTFVYNEAKRTIMREQLNMSDKLVIGTVGRLDYQKNPEYLIDIFEKIHSLNKDSVLIYIGDGVIRNQVKMYVREKELEDFVVFTGNISNVADYYQVFDAFLLPSRYEGLPIAGVEAQAAGLKCYFSDTISRELQLTDTVEFISIKEQPMLWAKKIISDQKGFVRKNCADQIKSKHFDVESMAAQVEKILDVKGW